MNKELPVEYGISNKAVWFLVRFMYVFREYYEITIVLLGKSVNKQSGDNLFKLNLWQVMTGDDRYLSNDLLAKVSWNDGVVTGVTPLFLYNIYYI